MFVKTSNKTVKKIIRPENFGAVPYMKPLDGRLELGVNFPTITYTPLGNGTTRITSSLPNTFNNDDLNKNFCGLFANFNNDIPDGDPKDSFAPNTISSRYSTVIEIEDQENIIVDFQYSGDDKDNISTSFSGKGYIFFDNSEALNTTFNEYYQNSVYSEKRYIVFKSLAVSNFRLICYVAPELDELQILSKDTYFITTNKREARIKFGIEDYYWYELSIEDNPKFTQPQGLFNLSGTNCNTVFNNVQLTPPHRFLKGNGLFSREVLSLAAGISGITAFVNFNNDQELKSIENGGGVTKEHFQLQAGSAGRGGDYTLDDNSLLDDVEKFYYQYFNNFTFKGAGAAGNMNTNGRGGGTFLILDKGLCDFNPETDFNAVVQEGQMKISTDKSGLPSHFSNPGYSPYIFEIDDPNGNTNFYKTTTLGGSNRHNIIVIEADDGQGLLFMSTTSEGLACNFISYDPLFVLPADRFDPASGEKYRAHTATKQQILQQIPEVNQTYTVSRNYTNTKDDLNAQYYVDTVDSDTIRTWVSWTTILGKKAENIDIANEIPDNGKPLELQCGDQFTIVGEDSEVYTVISKDIGQYTSLPHEVYSDATAEFGGGYRYFEVILDKNLPVGVGTTFEITITKSVSEHLLDGASRNCRISYAAFNSYRRNIPSSSSPLSENTLFNDPVVSRAGNPRGHLAYTGAEVTKYFRDVNFDSGFWRENQGTYSYTPIPLNDGTNVKPIRYYPKGVWLINCVNAMKGGTNDSWMGSSVSRRSYDNQRKIIEQENYTPEYVERDGIQYPPKYRIYNTPDATLPGGEVANPDYTIEQYETDENAPDLPAPIINLLKKLK